MSNNIYFDLTREFNAHRREVALASGQAVVFYRLAIMSKDGDWILRETESACSRVLEVLSAHAARYRAGAPLDVRWLAGGWSSHFELVDARGRRVRCDFFSRPPRIPNETLRQLFEMEARPADEPAVVGIEGLIRMKQTQRAKDYPVIGELARLLPPERELALTTDPDRILELAPRLGAESERPCVRKAAAGADRRAVVLALAEEIDHLQQLDRRRVETYSKAAAPYLQSFRSLGRAELELPAGHARILTLAEHHLPRTPSVEDNDAAAE